MKRYIMKKLLICVSLILCSVSYAATMNLHWLNEDKSAYINTTCTIDGDLILPTPPTKRGYTFMGWRTTNVQKIEYIESNGTQYIDTGIKQARFVHDISFTNKNNLNLMGNSASAGCYWGQSRQSFDGYELATSYIQMDSSVRRTIEYNNLNTNNVTLSVGDQTMSYKSSNFGMTYTIFRINNSSTYYTRSRLYGFQAYDSSDNLILNLVPVRKKTDNTVGLYDTISGELFTNKGTGVFVAGPDVIE